MHCHRSAPGFLVALPLVGLALCGCLGLAHFANLACLPCAIVTWAMRALAVVRPYGPTAGIGASHLPQEHFATQAERFPGGPFNKSLCVVFMATVSLIVTRHASTISQRHNPALERTG
jgi:hypothetical protein